MVSDNTPNVKRVGVSIPLFAEMVTKGWTVGKDSYIECIEGLPIGAQYVGGWVDHERLVVWLVFTHPSFERVLWGETIPELKVVLQKKVQ